MLQPKEIIQTLSSKENELKTRKASVGLISGIIKDAKSFLSNLFFQSVKEIRGNKFDVEVKNPTKLPEVFKVDGEVSLKDTKAILVGLNEVVRGIDKTKKYYEEQTKRLEKSLKPEKVDFGSLEKAINDIYIPDPVKTVSVDNFTDYNKKLDEIKKEIGKLKLDPKIEVQPAKVSIDLDGVKSRLETLVGEIKRIPKPEKQEFDLSKVENAVDKTTKAIKELVFPVPTTKTDHIATEATLKETLNKVAQKITTSGEYIYVAKAPIGTAQATAGWQVKRIHDDGTTMTITWADGNEKYDNVATNLASLSYS